MLRILFKKYHRNLYLMEIILDINTLSILYIFVEDSRIFLLIDGSINPTYGFMRVNILVCYFFFCLVGIFEFVAFGKRVNFPSGILHLSVLHSECITLKGTGEEVEEGAKQEFAVNSE